MPDSLSASDAEVADKLVHDLLEAFRIRSIGDEVSARFAIRAYLDSPEPDVSVARGRSLFAAAIGCTAVTVRSAMAALRIEPARWEIAAYGVTRHDNVEHHAQARAAVLALLNAEPDASVDDVLKPFVRPILVGEPDAAESLVVEAVWLAVLVGSSTVVARRA
jgi:hypothetical protein